MYSVYSICIWSVLFVYLISVVHEVHRHAEGQRVMIRVS